MISNNDEKLWNELPTQTLQKIVNYLTVLIIYIIINL